MADTFLEVTQGTGTKLHTFDRTIGANTVHDEVVLLGEPYVAAYAVATRGVAMPAANAHLIEVRAGTTLITRVRRIRVFQWATAAAAATFQAAVIRITTAGTGGTTLTAQPFDTADTAFTGSVMHSPTADGTDGVELIPFFMACTNVVPIKAVENEWVRDFPADGPKAIKIAAGTSNGIAINVLTIGSTALLGVEIVLTESNF